MHGHSCWRHFSLSLFLLSFFFQDAAEWAREEAERSAAAAAMEQMRAEQAEYWASEAAEDEKEHRADL